jgi:hypothetical protein
LILIFILFDCFSHYFSSVLNRARRLSCRSY